MIDPQDVRVVFVVNPDFEDRFLDFIHNLGYHWFHKDFNQLRTHMETKNCMMFYSEDPFLPKLFTRLNKDDCIGKFFHLVGCSHLIDRISFVSHYITNTKSEFGELNIWYKKVYGISFNDDVLKQ